MVDEYSNAGDQIKEALIDEFLRSNPGVARSQVVTRLVNGRMVCDTIDKVMASASKLRIQKEDKEALQKHLAVQEDERYQACQTAINSAKKIVNFLFASTFAAFDLTEKNENLNFLRRNERLVLDRSHNLHEIKKEFLQMMGGKINPTHARTKSEVSRYFKAVLEQLKAQHAIYKREHELGTRFSTNCRDFIKDNIASVKGQLKKTTLKTVSQAYAIAKRESAATGGASDISREALEEALAEMDESLDKRRIQFQAIEKIIAYLEKLVKEIETSGGPAPKETQNGDPKPKKKGKGRMAFAMKLFGRKE